MSFPNQLSLLRIILAPVFLFLFLSGDPFYIKLSFIVLFIAVLTDWYDGWHARKFGQISKAGIFLDPLADKVLTSTAFIGFYLINIIPLWMVITVVVRDITITILRSIQELNGKTMKTSFIAKTKTFIQMTYIFLIVILICMTTFAIDPGLKNSIRNFIHSEINYYIIFFVTIITLYTGITYFFESKTLVKPVETN
ncbi:MAG: CDP-diacylglycerol--glycerol-3-phosphate 3-phosphatidyltransferase [bacterium]